MKSGWGWLNTPEFWAGLCTLMIGIMFFTNTESKLVKLLEVFPGHPAYWAFVIAVMGLAMMVTMIWDAVCARLGVMTLAFGGWMALTVLQLRAEYNLAVTWLSPVLAMMCVLGIYNASRITVERIKRLREQGGPKCLRDWVLSCHN